MKKILLYLSITGVTLLSCNKFDDSSLWDSIHNLNTRVEKLETLCDKMNTNIASLQIIVDALEKNDGIKSVSTLSDGTGYIITFVSGKYINIYHGINGENGSDGKDGTNGIDGKDGMTPTISVRKDTDGIYYWTVDGQWLIVNGDKIKASAIDGTNGNDGHNGQDGIDGKDGITPKFKIEEGYWYISYDNGASYEKLGKASGDNGLNGVNGDNFFKGVSIEDGYVCFILNDAESSTIKLSFASETALTVHIDEPGTLKYKLTEEQTRTTLSLKITGRITQADIKFINLMPTLAHLDLSKAFYERNGNNDIDINPYGINLINRTLYSVISPQNSAVVSCNYCVNLRNLTVIRDSVIVYAGENYRPRMGENIDTLFYANGITYINEDAYLFPNVVLPATVQEVRWTAFSNHDTPYLRNIICQAENPPKVTGGWGQYEGEFYDQNDVLKLFTLYVPKESVDLYKSAGGWEQFSVILPIEE